jgi:demethylspheroidene O-methyltransferase
MRDRLLALRDRVLTSPRFQRLAAAFPLSRPIANAQAQQAFDICAGFVYSQVALACVSLGVLESVRSGPVPIEDLASRAELPAARAVVLVDAAVAIGLLSRRSGQRVGLGARGAAIVANPGILAMIRHHALLYSDLADPVALLRAAPARSRIRQFWAYAGGGGRSPDDRDDIEKYTHLMSESQQLIADDIIAAVPFATFRRVLDVGGGDGTFISTVTRALPAMQAVLFDLPAVAELARDKFESLGLRGRCVACGGDFLADTLPTGFDAVTLVRVLHDHDDEAAIRLLRAAREAIRPGGAIFIAEPMSGVAGAAVVADAYFGFYLLAMGSGRPRSPEAIFELLDAAGFRNARRIATRRPFLVSIVRAESEGE